MLGERLRRAVAGGPDAEAALVRLDRFIAAAGDLQAAVPSEEAERLLVLLLGQSPYLAQMLVREPAALGRLAADPDLRREKSGAVMRRELAACLEGAPLYAGLRRYRNREYLRLGARELGYGAATEVGRELAALAGAILDGALGQLYAELVARWGEPRREDGARCRFVVMGMGKLGGEELNFSSDIDLIYLYETDQGTVGDGEVTLHEFFARLCERLGRAVSDVTEDGFCFRVDLRLRPEGTRGPICNSLAAAEQYYEAWGRPWERQAWIKAAPVAGDLDLGEEALRLYEPFVWPRLTSPAIIGAVQELMGRIRAELASPGDVKVGPGGIREVEFFVQALQMVHAKLPAIRVRGTLPALERLFFAGLISGRELYTLGDAYAFLRRVEHRLQLEEGRQTHQLPDEPARRALLGERLGFAEPALFEAALAERRRAVSEIYATLGEAGDDVPADVRLLLEEAAPREAQVAALSRLGFLDPEASADELERLRRKPQSPFVPGAGEVAERVAPLLLVDAAASPDPDQALRHLVDLVGRRGSASTLWRLFAEHRPLRQLVMTLFGTSEFLAAELCAHPELTEPLLSAQQAQPEAGREDFAARITEALRGLDPDDEEGRLNALRRVKREEILRIGLWDVGGELSPRSVSRQLSELAECLLAAALETVTPPIYRRYGVPAATFCVVALGKLGGGELSYSSDLDLVFVYGDEGTAVGGREASHGELFARLVQRLLNALGAYMDEGRLYEVDTRLRPSGNQGALVSSLAAFRAYHQKEAALWERQALIKARAVAGDAALGREIEAMAEAHVYGGAPPGEHMAEEIGRLRARMEKELGRETKTRFNIKSGRGGLVDVEFLAQYLQLLHGPAHPSVRQRGTEDALQALAAAGRLPPDEAQALLDSYRFLRRLENRLRIVHDRSIQELPEDERELGKLARRLGYHGEQPGARLLSDYRAHTGRVRAIYQRHLPLPGT